MSSAMTLVTNEFVNDFDREKLENNDFDLSKIDELKDGMNKLVSGSDALYDGLNTLLNSCNTLKSGMDDLTGGCAKIRNCANDLNNGAAALQNGAANLKNGLDSLKSNNDALNDGAKQVFETLLAEANKQIEKLMAQIEDLKNDIEIKDDTICRQYAAKEKLKERIKELEKNDTEGS